MQCDDMKARERLEIPRQDMPAQDPSIRNTNFDEVTHGFDAETAMREATRCLKCKKPKCVTGCPVNIDIPAFISLIEEGKFVEAAWKLKEQNSLPGVTGRVCPQETQCECLCINGAKGSPVSIGRLERFAADCERKSGTTKLPERAPPTGKKVAVVGSGPAGLTAAGDLTILGHEVTIFEALHEPGGVLVYGVPEFRLPNDIVHAEISALEQLGVRLVTDRVVGRAGTVDSLLEDEFDAAFIGVGAGLPIFMDIPGEDLIGVYSANEYLTRTNLMRTYKFPDYATAPVRSTRAVVVGGGNVAMDSVRTAVRLGAKGTIVYRRSRQEMPARDEEIQHAEEEGIEFKLLCNPTRIVGNKKGQVVGVECLRMELGEPDDSGRRRPAPVKGSEFFIEADTFILALGNRPNPLIGQTMPDLELTRWNTIVVDEQTMATSKPGVYAGGDIVSGAATVIMAMGQGKIAAKGIHDYLMGPPDMDEDSERKTAM